MFFANKGLNFQSRVLIAGFGTFITTRTGEVFSTAKPSEFVLKCLKLEGLFPSAESQFKAENLMHAELAS